MKKLPLVILLLILPAMAFAQSTSPTKPAELAQVVSDAYTAKTLADLDKKLLAAASVTVAIEHSLMEGKNGNGLIVVRRFKNLAAVDKWLNSKQREDGSPFRQTKPLLKCSRGRCEYNFDGGILHNQLYLHDLYYKAVNGKLIITKLHLLDGD